MTVSLVSDMIRVPLDVQQKSEKKSTIYRITITNQNHLLVNV